MKKKILFVNGHLGVGGVEKSLVVLLQALDYSKYEVDLLLLESKGIYSATIPSSVRVILYETPKAFGPFISTICKHLAHLNFSYVLFRLIYVLAPHFGNWMYKFIRPLLGIRKYYDCAIAYRVGMPNEIASLVVKAKKKVCWWHNGECYYNQRQIKHIRDLWRNMDTIVAVSYGCKQMIVEKFSIDKEKVHVIPNIIDIDTIQQMAGNMNPYSDVASVRIVSLGRLCWEKHLEDVPEIAYNLINKGIQNFKWYIIGDGVKREEINAKIRKYHMEDLVIMLGRKENPYPYLKYADMMVHTSYVEAHCLTLLEAMALKTPCVAVKTVIPQDFTEDGVNCFLAEQNIDSIITNTIKMIYNNDLYFLVENAYKMVNDCYLSKTIIPQVDRIFDV